MKGGGSKSHSGACLIMSKPTMMYSFSALVKTENRKERGEGIDFRRNGKKYEKEEKQRGK